jgi:RNA polymerase sigma factor (sigma-70 family)
MSKNQVGLELLELFEVGIYSARKPEFPVHIASVPSQPRSAITRAPAEVPDWLKENYRAAYFAGKSREECWDCAVSGKNIPVEKAESYKAGVAKCIGDSDKANLRKSLLEASKELVVLEDRVALEATAPGAEVDWTSARRQTIREMAANGTPVGIARMAARFADGLKQTTPSKLRRLEAEKSRIVEKVYPDARIYTDHSEAWEQVAKACNENNISPPAPQREEEILKKLTPMQRTALEIGEKTRGAIAMIHYTQARQNAGKAGVPSNAERAALKALQKSLGKAYATLPSGWSHREMEQMLINQRQQPVPPVATNRVKASVNKLETLDNYGLSPVHFAAAAGKLDEIKDILVANPHLLEVPAGTNGDPQDGQEQSKYENPTSRAVRYLGLGEKEGQRFMVAMDRTGITAAQMAVQFGHGEQLAACGYLKEVPPLTKSQRIDLGKDGREMLAEQYFPLSIILGGSQAEKKGISIDEALGETDLKFKKMLDSYSPAAGTNFPEYAATPIGLSVIDKLRSDDERTREFAEMKKNIDQLKEAMVQAFSRDPDNRDLANAFGCSEEKIEEMERNITKSQFHSIDAPRDDGNGERDSHEFIEDTAHEAEFHMDFEQREALREGMANVAPKLDEDERHVMVLQYGCDCPIKDIAWMMDRSENYIYQIREIVEAKLWRELQPTLNSGRSRNKDSAKKEHVKPAAFAQVQRSGKLQEVVQGD